MGKQARSRLTVFTNGSFKQYNLSEYLKPLIQNDLLTVVEELPPKIDLAILSPRPTTLDVAVIQEKSDIRPYKIA